MRRFALVPVLALAALACQDQPVPTDGVAGPPAASVDLSPEQAALADDIEDLLRALFPEPGLETAALTQFGNVERELADGNTGEARAKAFDLVDFALEKLAEGKLENPGGGTESAVSELVDLLLAFVGLTPPEVSPSVLSGETDGVVAIASPDEDNLIVTENEFAATFIEAGDLAEERVIVIERVDPAEQSGGACLPADGVLEQREGCYRFDKSPDDPFEDEVLVAVCPEAGIRDETDPNVEEFQLAKFDPANPADGVVALPSASEDVLDCSGFDPLARAGDGALRRLARSGWEATGGRLLDWLGPARAEAVNLGFGGATADFSRIGWARLLDVTASAGDGQTDFAGFPVDTDPTVDVTSVHGPSAPAALEDVDVTFSVAGGGGTVGAGQSSVTVNTDAAGLASVPWRLGSAGANALEATAGGETVTFSATADAATLPIQCSGDGGDRILNDGAVGRAFYVPAYPSSELSQVDLWLAADVAETYTVQLTVLEDGFGGDTLGTATANVQLSGDATAFTQATFSFAIDDITAGSTVAFDPVVIDAPSPAGTAEVFMEVPTTDPDPQFVFDGDADCPIIETTDASAPLSTDRRQGVRAIITGGPILQ